MSDRSKKLGMYVHTHWGYSHPYCACSWTPADWEGYLAGLARLGSDFVMVWPQLDCMPPEPNAGGPGGPWWVENYFPRASLAW